jgi:pyrroloquinoline-quinone synthase
MNTSNNTPWTRTEFEAQLRGMEKYYHINHPYNVMMNEGKQGRVETRLTYW